MQIQRHFHVWSGCDERMAKAALALKESFDEFGAKGSQRIPLKRLIREHLDPALEAIASEIVGVGSSLVEHKFGRNGLSGWHKKLGRLDIAICDFASACDVRILRSIDTLRYILFYIRPSPSSRITPKEVRGLRGAERRRLPSSRSGTKLDWPYCELCYRITEAASQELLRNRTPFETEKIYPIVSARYCHYHSARCGRAYDRDFRHRERFKKILAAAYSEFSVDRRFSHRFAGLAPEDTLVTTALGGARLYDLEDFSDQVCKVRHYAYLVAQQPTLERTIMIALLRASGLSYAQVAKELGISPSAVMQRVKKSRGCFDFSRSDPLIFWWPDSLLTGRATFKLSSSDPVPIPIAQLARTVLINLNREPPIANGTVGDQRESLLSN